MSEPRVIVAGWYTVDPKRRDEVVQNSRDLVIRARQAAGALDFAITADPIDPARINLFELWRSESDLSAWRGASKAPKKTPAPQRIEVQKHVVQESGPPFGRRRGKR